MTIALVIAGVCAASLLLGVVLGTVMHRVDQPQPRIPEPATPETLAFFESFADCLWCDNDATGVMSGEGPCPLCAERLDQIEQELYPDITEENLPDWFDRIPIGVWR